MGSPECSEVERMTLTGGRGGNVNPSAGWEDGVIRPSAFEVVGGDG